MVWNAVIWPAARTTTTRGNVEIARKGGSEASVLTSATMSPAAIAEALRSTGYLPSAGLSTVVFLATAMNRPTPLEASRARERPPLRRPGR